MVPLEFSVSILCSTKFPVIGVTGIPHEYSHHPTVTFLELQKIHHPHRKTTLFQNVTKSNNMFYQDSVG